MNADKLYLRLRMPVRGFVLFSAAHLRWRIALSVIMLPVITALMIRGGILRASGDEMEDAFNTAS